MTDGVHHGFFENIKQNLPYFLTRACPLDDDYSGQFVPANKRWVVERTFAWLENFRKLCRNYEETTESVNEMLMVAAVVITLRKLTSVNNRF